MELLTITNVALCAVLCTVVQAVFTDPCLTKVCQAGQECRIVETCNTNVCSIQAVCLAATQSDGGCNTGKPQLSPKQGGGYELRSCYSSRNCGDGFYCSTALQDVSSRCCRASQPSTPKPGTCPAVDPESYYFCVDGCRSDADCDWDYKCCQKSVTCTRRVCSPPDPCSIKTCASGQECVVTPNFKAECVALTPEVQPPAPPTGGSTNVHLQPPTASDEPLCQAQICQPGQECRVVETCSNNACSVQAICLAATQSDGGCNTGKPQLSPKQGGGYELRTCYSSRNCGDGFYCSTALQDVSSRCCRASQNSTMKPGQCSALEQGDNFFCVDGCRGDNDCLWGEKCCRDSQSCARNTCQSPSPCSLKSCPTGRTCVETPDRTAQCVAAPPPTPSPGGGNQPPPPQPTNGGNSNNNNNMQLQPTGPNNYNFWNNPYNSFFGTNNNNRNNILGANNNNNNNNNNRNNILGANNNYNNYNNNNQLQQPGPMTCPSPAGPYGDGECTQENQCGYPGRWPCARGTLCCSTSHCGNICRAPILMRYARWFYRN